MSKAGRPPKSDGPPRTFKDWYKDNKTALAEKRKLRYETDSKYRDKCLERNRVAREAKQATRPARPDGEKPRKTVVVNVLVNGQMIPTTGYHIGELADRLERSVPTLYGWERSGVLPVTPLNTSSKKPERLYTEPMMNVVIEAFNRRSQKVSGGDITFYNEVSQGWRAVGVNPVEEDASNAAPAQKF